MKKTNIFTCLMSGLLALSSCVNYNDLVPAEFHNVLNIKNNGLRNVTLYTTGDEPTWNFTILKGGSEVGYQSSASISIMPEDQYLEYRENNNIIADILPKECYNIPETEFQFSSDDTYKIVGIQFKPSKIKELMEETGKQYALPVVMNSDVSNINNNIIIVKLNVETPMLEFNVSGSNIFVDAATLSVTGEERLAIETYVNFSTTNQEFTFDATVSDKAKSVFEEYNQENGGRFNLLPEAAYTINGSNGTGLSFPKDATEMALSIELDRTKIDCGEYILPLSLSNLSNENFKINAKKEVVLLGIKYLPPKLDLTVDQLSTNSVHAGDGTGLPGLIDGDLTGSGYFHSKWQNMVVDPIYGNYIQVELRKPIKSLSFDYVNRKKAGGAPTDIKLFISNDGQNWTEWQRINRGLPQAASAKYSSNIFISETSFKYVRFAVLESVAGSMTTAPGSFFNLHELTFYGN